MTVLVVDVGSVNTVAVTAATGGEPRLVTVDGAPWIPTAVHLGADAVRLGRGPAARDVRAVLTRVVEAAGTPDELVLTHPAGWTADRIAELTDAAAGLAPKITTVTEPVAAAPDGTSLVVDAGGGTFDVAVVRQGTVLASASLPVDFDQRILDRLQPSLREPVESVRDRQQLADSARAAKELLSRHDRADIVLPDHRAVRLTRTEFEELIAPDIDRVIALAAQVVGPTQLDRVLLVGGSSRVPLLARRLAEAAGRPVHLDPEPETAVARGAALRATTPTATKRPHLAIAALALALLLVAAIFLVPGQRMTGRAVAGATPPTSAPLTLPPAAAGTELVNTERPVFDDAEFGDPVTYRDASGTELELVFGRMETRPLGAGYRWLYVSYQATHVAGPEWREPFASTAALDDRGQWIRPLAGGVACDGAAEPVTTVAAGATVEVCGMLPVPDQTTVEALVFGSAEGDGEAVRVPTSVTPVQGAGPAPASIAGRLGGPPVTVDDLGLTATFDLVVTPSAYLGERRPSGGNRLVVLRAALSTVADQVFYLRDDRGVLTPPLPDVGDLPDCPALEPTADPVYACLVYEVDADSPIAGVTVGRPLESESDLAHWPTWTP